MESRHRYLLKVGWERGRLDFNYTQPYSELREQFILRELERELTSNLIHARLLSDAAILSGVAAGNKQAFKVVQEGQELYSELTLPYRVKPSKIKKDLSQEDIAAMKASIADVRKQLVDSKYLKKNVK